jgi:hypothetical protein
MNPGKFSSLKSSGVGRAKAPRLKTRNPERARAHGRKYSRLRSGWAPGEHEKAKAIRPFVEACACCGSPEPLSKDSWAGDHDHETGKFRAFVCFPCNIAIGLVEKYGLDMSPSIAAYLAPHTDARRLRKALRQNVEARHVP